MQFLDIPTQTKTNLTITNTQNFKGGKLSDCGCLSYGSVQVNSTVYFARFKKGSGISLKIQVFWHVL